MSVWLRYTGVLVCVCVMCMGVCMCVVTSIDFELSITHRSLVEAW